MATQIRFVHKGILWWREESVKLVDHRNSDLLLIMQPTKDGLLKLTRKVPANSTLDRSAELSLSVAHKLYNGLPVSLADIQGSGLSLVSTVEKCVHFNFDPDCKQSGVIEVHLYEVQQALAGLFLSEKWIDESDSEKAKT